MENIGWCPENKKLWWLQNGSEYFVETWEILRKFSQKKKKQKQQQQQKKWQPQIWDLKYLLLMRKVQYLDTTRDLLTKFDMKQEYIDWTSKL